MLEREIIKIERNQLGDIVALRNQFMGWSPVAADYAIKHIEGGLYKYFVSIPNVGKIYLTVIDENNKKVIRTDPSVTSRDLLEVLPSYAS
ncbi:MAG: hypothetical protein IPM32_09115 [Ignavibacteriae bacterium]|nr:hypothetical protein [Ignavibacteriota bacterium]